MLASSSQHDEDNREKSQLLPSHTKVTEDDAPAGRLLPQVVQALRLDIGCAAWRAEEPEKVQAMPDMPRKAGGVVQQASQRARRISRDRVSGNDRGHGYGWIEDLYLSECPCPVFCVLHCLSSAGRHMQRHRRNMQGGLQPRSRNRFPIRE